MWESPPSLKAGLDQHPEGAAAMADGVLLGRAVGRHGLVAPAERELDDREVVQPQGPLGVDRDHPPREVELQDT